VRTPTGWLRSSCSTPSNSSGALRRLSERQNSDLKPRLGLKPKNSPSSPDPRQQTVLDRGARLGRPASVRTQSPQSEVCCSVAGCDQVRRPSPSLWPEQEPPAVSKLKIEVPLLGALRNGRDLWIQTHGRPADRTHQPPGVKRASRRSTSSAGRERKVFPHHGENCQHQFSVRAIGIRLAIKQGEGRSDRPPPCRRYPT